MSDAHQCPCGRPAPDANLCNRCAENLRDNLLKIAERWTDLTDALTWAETPHAGPTPPKPRATEPDDGAGNPTGLVTNAQASRAMAKASSVIWYAVSVLRDDYNDRDKAFRPPGTNGSMDDIPKLARWIGMWHLSHLVHKLPDEGTVEAIAQDVADAELAIYRTLRPTGERWAPVNLACTDHATTDLGERVPCPGHMWAKVGGDLMPDLVCDHDPLHVIEPGVWERQGWKARLAGPLHVAGMARLAQRLAR